MPLSVVVVLGPDDFVFNGDPAPPEKGHSLPTQLLAHVYVAKRLGGSRCHLVQR